jgi:hypothetical protein
MSNNLQPRLISIMQREMDFLSFKPPTSCKSQMDSMVAQGLTRMRISKALDNPGQVLLAERNLKELVKYLSDYSREVGSYPSIEEADFHAAMLASPAYWPYCA